MTKHSAKRSGQSKTLTPEQLDQVIHNLPSYKHQIVALTMRNCACRINECLSLTWECFEKDYLVFPYFITKGRLNTRTIPLAPKFTKTILEWKKHCEELKGSELLETDYIFPGRYGFNEPLSVRAFQYALKDATNKTEITKFSSHGFRRTCLTSGNSKGVSLRTLQELSGHKSLETLKRYLEVSEEQKREAIMAFS